MVKRPEHYDIYDLAFAEFFRDAVVDWDKMPEVSERCCSGFRTRRTSGN